MPADEWGTPDFGFDAAKERVRADQKEFVEDAALVGGLWWLSNHGQQGPPPPYQGDRRNYDGSFQSPPQHSAGPVHRNGWATFGRVCAVLIFIQIVWMLFH